MDVKISGQKFEEEEDLHNLKICINYSGKDRNFPEEKPDRHDLD